MHRAREWSPSRWRQRLLPRLAIRADGWDGPATTGRHAAVNAIVAEAAGHGIFRPTGDASLRRLDREEHNIRAAIGWSFANDQPGVGPWIIGWTWRWFRQRGGLLQSRALLAQLLAGTSPVRDRCPLPHR